MFSSSIDPQIIQAYLETEYRVNGSPGFTLKVGQANTELLSAHESEKAQCSAFVTACNPFSQSSDETANAARQADLAKELGHRNIPFRPGMGKHPSNEWPGEDSFLVFGLSLEAAKALCRQLEQNAFVWSGADAVPQLILLR